jgi:hypothetical protein
VSVVTIGVGLLAFGGLPQGLSEPPALALGPLAIPRHVALAIAAFVVPVVGLFWMIRIFRGPRDEAPAWRYRAS